MMLASPALPFVLSFAAGATVTAIPLLFRLSVAKRQSAHWERRATAWVQNWWRECCALTEAEQKLAAIHSQHVEAGKQSHRAEKARCAETTRALALSIGRPDLAERINDPLDDTGRGVAPVSTSARAGFGSSAPLSHDPAAAQRAPIEGGTVGTCRSAGQDMGVTLSTRRGGQATGMRRSIPAEATMPVIPPPLISR